MCQPPQPSRGGIVACVDQGVGPLSKGGRNPFVRPEPKEGSACRSTSSETGMLSCVGWVIPLSKEGKSSPHRHVIMSPAVGQKHREKEPLKQCLKNTCRHMQKTCHCFSFRVPRTRSAGVESGGAWSVSCVHLQIGSGEVSHDHLAKAVCLGVGVGGLAWWASFAIARSSARFQFFWGGPGQECGKTLGSAFDFFPRRWTEKGWVVREESSSMRSTKMIKVKRDALGRYFCFRKEKRRRRMCLLWMNRRIWEGATHAMACIASRDTWMAVVMESGLRWKPWSTTSPSCAMRKADAFRDGCGMG